jgi:hypothetical protein
VLYIVVSVESFPSIVKLRSFPIGTYSVFEIVWFLSVTFSLSVIVFISEALTVKTNLVILEGIAFLRTVILLLPSLYGFQFPPTVKVTGNVFWLFELLELPPPPPPPQLVKNVNKIKKINSFDDLEKANIWFPPL